MIAVIYYVSLLPMQVQTYNTVVWCMFGETAMIIHGSKLLLGFHQAVFSTANLMISRLADILGRWAGTSSDQVEIPWKGTKHYE